jgi:hypothetical protein
MVGEAWQAMYEGASDHMADLGVIDGDAFTDFVNSDPIAMRELMEGAQALAAYNSTEGLDAVAGKFMEQADAYMPDAVMDALDEAGFDYESNGKGGLNVITNDGMSIPFNVAVRQQIIRFI